MPEKSGIITAASGLICAVFRFNFVRSTGLTFGFSRNHSARGFASKFNTAYQGGFFSRKIHV
ncbi:hypothetical protein GPA73_004574 [Salmonella enterica]|nr:hypothetical protein [Salmonella enterica]